MSQSGLETYAQGMYERVNAMWADRGHEIFEGACGFSILSGPPIYRPALTIIGANPGFGADDHEPHVEKHWPSRSYIDDADWTLARKLRAIFKSGALSQALSGAMQTNFQFFKSSSINRPGRYRWKALESVLQHDLSCFCLQELTGYVQASEPTAVLVLGTDTFDRHVGNGEVTLRDRSGKRRLLIKGRLAGIPAYGVLHPTGAQVASDDWTRVAEQLESTLVAR